MSTPHSHGKRERSRNAKAFVKQALLAAERGEAADVLISLWCALDWVLEPDEAKDFRRARHTYNAMIDLLGGRKAVRRARKQA